MASTTCAWLRGGCARQWMSPRDVFPTSWFAPLHKTAKAITAALGAVRDRDVLLEFLTAERASAPASDRLGSTA